MKELLDIGVYKKDEIFDYFDLKKSNTNATRKAKNMLTHLGYSFVWNYKDVQITKAPVEVDARIKQIIMTKFNQPSTINFDAFGMMLYRFATEYEFGSCPWGERQKMLEEENGIVISDRTLKQYAKSLIDMGLLYKDTSEKEVWVTKYTTEGKIRRPVYFNTADEYEYRDYMARRKELLKEYKDNDDKWGKAFKELWQEFGCCYYNCCYVTTNAIMDKDITQLLELLEVKFGRSEIDNEYMEVIQHRYIF